MTKYLITGFSGFVSRHFLDLLESEGEAASVMGIDINEPDFDYRHFKFVKCMFRVLDLLQKDDVDNVIYQYQPTHIVHLASFSSVAFSWKNPSTSFANNTNIFLNLVEQVRKLNIKCRILSVGSSEEYGNVTENQIPLHEDMELNPVSPYAVARVSQEMLSKVYVKSYGMDIVLTRSFNHTGPFQKDIFVVPSFARQLCQMAKSQEPHIMTTGRLEIVRDFVDVRDVVKAYLLLLRKGKSGEVYNVCSGKGTTLHEVIHTMTAILGITVQCETDPNLVRPNDNQIIIGSNAKIAHDVGWTPAIPIQKSLADVIDYWNSNS
jgi:GDP-4-dehydro-6-deoxy-D-mannose reductase